MSHTMPDCSMSIQTRLDVISRQKPKWRNRYKRPSLCCISVPALSFVHIVPEPIRQVVNVNNPNKGRHRCMYMPEFSMTDPYRSFARHKYLRNMIAFK